MSAPWVTAPSRLIPVPHERPRWRMLVARRVFADTAPSVVGELTSDARSVRLETALNVPSTFTATIDGDSRSAYLLREGEHDVLVYRWSEVEGTDVEMGRFIVAQTQDTFSPDRHTVNVTAHDYLWMLNNRKFTQAQNWPQADQDTMVGYLVTYWARMFPRSQVNAFFGPGSYLPLQLARCQPDGTPGRALSGQIRDRNYEGQQVIGDLLSNLAAVINGFDYSVEPVRGADFVGPDRLAVYYPNRGTQRDFALTYPQGNVRGGSRSVNLANFGNYARVIGQSEEGQPQLFAEAWQGQPGNPGPTVDDPIQNPLGMWMLADSFTDVTVQATLVEKVRGLLASGSGALDEQGRPTLVPSYSLELEGGAFVDRAFGLGDSVRLQINSGRVESDTWVRVVAMRYIVGDDGAEDVEVDVGNPSPVYRQLMNERRRRDRLATLERR